MEQTKLTVRARRSTQEVLRLLEEFRRSGLSVKEFCQRNAISKASFHKWQSRHRKKEQQPEKPSGFARLAITTSPALTEAVLFAEVKGIKIYQIVTASFLKELMQ